jgi:carboxymethylenebutenolidase
LIEETIEIHTADGTADAILYQPEAGRRYPGVIHLTDIGGIRPAQQEMARRLASEGYAVLMPNVFYRTRKPPVFDFPAKPLPDKLGPAKLGDERMKRVAELSAPLTAEAMARDACAYVDFLAEHNSVSQGAIGVVGYCLTGRMALYIAKARAGKVRAAASFHGARLATDAPDSPHLALPAIQARLYFGHATNDRGMPAEAIAKLDDALAAWGGQYESEVYDGAYHSWTVPDSPVYNQSQAERAFEKLKSLFAETLR